MKWKSHHLLDFGDSFGSDNDIARNPLHGQEFWLTSREQANALWRWDSFRLPGRRRSIRTTCRQQETSQRQASTRSHGSLTI